MMHFIIQNFSEAFQVFVRKKKLRDQRELDGSGNFPLLTVHISMKSLSEILARFKLQI